MEVEVREMGLEGLHEKAKKFQRFKKKKIQERT